MRTILLFLVLLSLTAFSLSWGSAGFDLGSWLCEEGSEFQRAIFFNNRLPRTLLALLAGSGAAVAGLLLQTIFRNPLAGPTTLGINSGASLGVALYYFLISSGLTALTVAGPASFAAVGAIVFLVIIVLFSKRFESVYTLLIVGLLMGYLAYAIVELLIQFSSEGGIRSYVFWGMGSFNGGNDLQIAALGVLTALAVLYAWIQREQLNLYLLGEEELKLRKGNPFQLKWQVLVLTGLLVGIATSITGPLAFIGVIAPNIIKFILGTLNHRKLIWKVIFLGSSMALAADLIARGALFDRSLPLNAILSLMSVPILLILLKKPDHAN